MKTDARDVVSMGMMNIAVGEGTCTSSCRDVACSEVSWFLGYLRYEGTGEKDSDLLRKEVEEK